ncbi:MAG: ribonuclease H family protein [Lachnospiraceae bacterium]|nr:ribonuclease H family protein [Lachnospiraceae bacterium]
MAKYYAVKVGRKTGIFETWDECKGYVSGYPGALYKSFKSMSEASEYMGWSGEQISMFDFDTLPSKEDGTIDFTTKESELGSVVEADSLPYSDKKHATAYVDGSYNQATKIFSYGVVMFYDGTQIHLSDCSSDSELAQMRNVAGEIHGSMAAMRFALEKGCREITIYHDYEGIAKWPTGQWKATKEGTIAYKKYYDSIKKDLKVNFIKVKGHSGDKYNDLADILAKKAAGIEE